MNSSNPLPWMGAVLAAILASFALVREPVSPQEGTPESSIGVQSAEITGLTLMASQSGTIEKETDRLPESRVTSFIGRSIDSPEGNKAGEIKDLILDEAGRVTHAILSHGGLGGLGARQVAIPWQALQDRIRGDRIVLDPSQLERAPPVPEDNPHFTDGSWSRESDDYWERFRVALSEDVDANSTTTELD